MRHKITLLAKNGGGKLFLVPFLDLKGTVAKILNLWV